MKATITSTDKVVEINAIGPDGLTQGGMTQARVWEGATESGIRFTAYIPLVQVRTKDDNSQFERELSEHKRPDPGTQRAIDMRFIL